jgi:hypothetical protein
MIQYPIYGLGMVNLLYIEFCSESMRKGDKMKPIKGVLQNEVWVHWKKVENIPDNETNWRSDIRDPLPANLKWFLAEIDNGDIPKIHIISSDDWKHLTPTFKLIDAVDGLNKNPYDDIVRNILEKKRIYQNDIDGLDRKFILVSSSIKGNFTIIEGNKRAVALQSMKKLAGNQIYLGISSKIRNYWWARYSA